MRTRLLVMCSVCLALCTTLIVVNVTLAGISAEPGFAGARQQTEPSVDDPESTPEGPEEAPLAEPMIELPPDSTIEVFPETLIEMPPPETIVVSPIPFPDPWQYLAIDREPSWFSDESDATSSVAWADVDLDGDLDLAVGNEFSDEGVGVSVYLSDEGRLPVNASWNTRAITGVLDLAWGDMDGDGDLDLAVARRAPLDDERGSSSVVLRNDGLSSRGELRLKQAWSSLPGTGTSVAWGDVDGDSDLDLAVGAGSWDTLDTTRVYLNDGSVLTNTNVWEDPSFNAVADVAWGDVDGDGDLDLAAGVAGYNIVFANEFIETGHFTLTQMWQSEDSLFTTSVAWVDVNEDGHVDLSVGNDSISDLDFVTVYDYGVNASIYLNGAGGLEGFPAWNSDAIERSTSVDWGDVDADGDFDLLIANDHAVGGFGATEVYVNHGWDEFGVPVLMSAWASLPLDNSHDAAFADADNDGDLDILVANYDHNLIYENRTGGVGSISAWQSPSTNTRATALGDYDRDGDLDLAMMLTDGNGVVVYRNDGPGQNGGPEFVESWRVVGDELYGTIGELAWGDVDGDGDLDLAIAGGHTQGSDDPGSVDRVYSNDGADANGNLLMSACWEAPHRDPSSSVAWGDVDGDGDLDLVFGIMEGTSKLYLNEGGFLNNGEPDWQSEEGRITSLAWGDVDGDGDLDLAAGVESGPNRIYFNDRGELELVASWESNDRDRTNSVAWGDVDNDGDLDLVAANPAIPAKLYLNQDGWLTENAAWQSSDVGETGAAEWGDVDGDGDLDLILADRSSSVRYYQNQHGELASRSSWRSGELYSGQDIAVGDVNNDGFLDIVAANAGDDEDDPPQPTTVHLGRRPAQLSFAGHAAGLSISQDHSPANFYALSAIQETGSIPFEFHFSSPDGLPPRDVLATFASGAPSATGNRWLPAKPTEPISMPIVIADGSAHPFVWDVYGSGFFGRSDNVTVRMEAYPSLLPQAHGIAGPYQRANVSAETLTMRVRGNQIRVVNEHGPAEDALVYRLRYQDAVAEPIGADDFNTGYRTDAGGYLQGHGLLNGVDSLVAMWPSEVITTPYNATVYQLSASPDENGLAFTEVSVGGVQTLTVSSENTLVLFDLDLSLAWDARNDGEFLQKLESAVEQASAVLYDVTNGQVALGEVRVHQNKELWPDAHIVLYAANNIHPRATMGGIVNEWVADTMIDGRTIADAYVPGQIRMGPLWDPFNQSQSELSVDWWRALAHELGHYLLFLPDNYLGIENDALKVTNCVGSLMTNAYDDKRYDEFLTEDGWTGQCLETMAAKLLTGRTDWATITHFFDMLQAPDAEGAAPNSGPESLPLGVTQVCFVEPGYDGWGDCLPYGEGTDESDVFTARPYDIRDAQNNLTLVRQGQTFLYKTELTTFDTGDDENRVVDIVPLGSTGSGRDVIMVRGAEVDDKVCLFDSQHSPPRVGCEAVSGVSPSVQIFEVDGWQPEIVVSPVIAVTPAVTATEGITRGTVVTGGSIISGGLTISDTGVTISRLAVTVTLPVSVASGRLMAQVIPAYEAELVSDANERAAPERLLLTLVQEGAGAGQGAGEGAERPWIYAGHVEPRYLAAEGFVRVWEPSEPNHEAVTQYFLSEGWDARNRGTSPTNKMDAEARNRGTSPTNRRDAEARNRGTSPTNRRDAEARNRGTSPTNRRDAEARNRGTSPTNRRAWRGNRRTLEAPVASGDGRVTIFNLQDIFASTGLVSLQALSNIPSLPPWFTPVGKVYRYESTEDFPATIAFHYLQREVPDGHEDAMRVYFRPDENATTGWQPLATDVDTRENLASARMPEPANGIYALVATVELPPLEPGWNLLAYTLPHSRTVESALASLDGKYSVLHSYLPGDESSWLSYDPKVAEAYGEMADLVNDLDELSFGHSYLIHATESVTPYLAVSGVGSTRYLSSGSATPGGESVQPQYDPQPPTAGSDDRLLVAPARFFGPITGTVSSSPDTDVTITARVDSTEQCGNGVLIELDGRPVYSLSVAAEAETSGCGRPGRTVEFLIGDKVVGRHVWRNQGANYLPLGIED